MDRVKKLNEKGFSLVEILIAIALLGVLMLMANSAYNTRNKLDSKRMILWQKV